LLSAFFAASLVLAVTPGPGVLYVVARSLAQGRHAALASVGGVALGNFCNSIAAAIGLGTLLSVSSIAFSILKYAGAAYLIYLGIRAFRALLPRIPEPLPPLSTMKLFRDGFVVALLNPKTAVFFAAFLPQFMSENSSPILQSVTLGALFVVIAALTDATYALSATFVAPKWKAKRGAENVGRYLSGGAYVGLGLFTALSDSRHK
jgi:threonine/homoserine/homoserine lactone efflux protein